MALALGAISVLLAAMLLELALPRAVPRLHRAIGAWRARRLAGSLASYDPGRELRAEQRARALLRSCVNEEEWAMYCELGFMRVWGSLSGALHPARCASRASRESAVQADYAYLVYPHRPIVAYLSQTGTLLNEYCVAFPDRSRPYGSTKLPASDDVLAKWMALNADERRLIGEANMHLPGRQIDPEKVRRDLSRLARWERERLTRRRIAQRDGASERKRAPLTACSVRGYDQLRREASQPGADRRS